MSGIPIYTQSPINASKASGASPLTATLGTQTTSHTSNPVPATTTASSTYSYPPAQPGAAAPAPTAAAQRYAPVQPTPTTTTGNEGCPPAPQPGAVPTPLNRKNIPPPPKAGETYNPPSSASMPPQMSIPPPNSAFRAQPAASSTSTSTTSSLAQSTHIVGANYGASQQSIEHPHGYQQNSYASDPSSDQRRAQEAANNSFHGYGSSENANSISTQSVWNTAKQMVAAAGNKLSETEQEIWRRINKE